MVLVFNERGEGVIVKGAQAQLHKDDKTPHLSEDDAHSLLKKAIEVYRLEHKTSPARVVIPQDVARHNGRGRGIRCGRTGARDRSRRTARCPAVPDALVL
jgi:hypothetical protein